MNTEGKTPQTGSEGVESSGREANHVPANTELVPLTTSDVKSPVAEVSEETSSTDSSGHEFAAGAGKEARATESSDARASTTGDQPVPEPGSPKAVEENAPASKSNDAYAPLTGDQPSRGPESREPVAGHRWPRFAESLKKLSAKVSSGTKADRKPMRAEVELTGPRSEARSTATGNKPLWLRLWKRLFKTDQAALTVEAPKGLPRIAEHVSGLRTIILDLALIDL